jgi:hypothetical protein
MVELVRMAMGGEQLGGSRRLWTTIHLVDRFDIQAYGLLLL